MTGIITQLCAELSKMWREAPNRISLCTWDMSEAKMEELARKKRHLLEEEEEDEEGLSLGYQKLGGIGWTEGPYLLPALRGRKRREGEGPRRVSLCYVFCFFT